VFRDRIGLAGQGRFAGRESRAFEDQGVSRDDVACPDAKQVSGNDRLHLDLPENAVAFDLGLERYRPPQDFRCPYGVSFLHGIESDRERQDKDDDRTTDRVAGQNGNNAGGQQNQGKRLQQSTQHCAQDAVGPGCRIAVGAILIEPLPGLVRTQTLQPAAKRRADLLRRELPEAVLGELRVIRHGILLKYSCNPILRRADAE
jgi:hypothetical protein